MVENLSDRPQGKKMIIYTKADLLKDLEKFDDNAKIWVDIQCMEDTNYLFSIDNPTENDGYTSWDVLIDDEIEEE